jgi:hypothetical protein
VVELGTGPAVFGLLPTFWPFQPVVLTFCAVLPVSQPRTNPQDSSSKRTGALNMISPCERFYKERGGKETQEGIPEQAATLHGHYSDWES